jgi:hypothetical protein
MDIPGLRNHTRRATEMASTKCAKGYRGAIGEATGPVCPTL